MNLGAWLLVILLLVALFSTQRSVRRSRSAEERFFAIRMSAVCWIAGFVFLVALLFLPNKQRVLLMLPLFLAAVTLAGVWRKGRARLRREHELRDNFGRAKRVN